MKKILSFLLISILTFSLTACGGMSPEKTFEAYIAALKEADYTTADTYLKIAEGSTESSVGETLAGEEELAKLMLKNLTYTVVSSTQNEEKTQATLTVEVTNTNLENFVAEYTKAALADVISNGLQNLGKDTTDDGLNMELVNKVFAECESTKLTTKVDVVLVKAEEGWKIEMTDQLMNAICGGIYNVFSLFSK